MKEAQFQFKKWEDLDITDDFIFSRVMRNKRLCRTLLEMILKVKIGKIKFLTSHHAIRVEPNAKGIIMDVYLKDENRVINVEMQATNKGDLARRARYYQAAADIDTEQLRDLDQELRLFYDYVRDKTAQTAFTKELDATISRMKQEKEERNMYLTYTSRMMECRRDGYEEGLHTGLTTGREEGISIGLERGAHQTKLETAKAMLSLGLPLDQIQLCTSLPLDAVLELAQTE